MTKKAKQYRFRCAVCGFLAWQSRLSRLYPLEVIDVHSNGRGTIKNIFLPWGSKRSLCSAFESHFYNVLDYLLRHKYIDASTVKKIVDVYAIAPDVFHPDLIFEPDIVYEPELVYTPEFVE